MLFGNKEQSCSGEEVLLAKLLIKRNALQLRAPAKCQRSAFCGNKEQTRNDEQNPLVDFVIIVGICDAAGVWLSLVEYLNGVQVAAGSNPVTPTIPLWTIYRPQRFFKNPIRTTSTIKNTAKLDVLRYFNIYKKFKPNTYRRSLKDFSFKIRISRTPCPKTIAASPKLFHAIRIGSIWLQPPSGCISRSRQPFPYATARR